MKWLIRTLLALLLLLCTVAAGAWIASPWLIQRAVSDVARSSNLTIDIDSPGIESTGAMGFKNLTITQTNNTPYTLKIERGHIHWHTPGRSLVSAISTIFNDTLKVDLSIEASLIALHLPHQDLTYNDSSIQSNVSVRVSRSAKGQWFLSPEALTYPIQQASLRKSTLQLEQIDYPLSLTMDTNRQPPTGQLRIGSVASSGSKAPIRNFTASIALNPDILSSGKITLTDCSLDIFEWKASTPIITYDRETKKTAFTLELQQIALEELPGLNDPKKPLAKGIASGNIPVAIQDSVISIHNATIRSQPGSRFIYSSSEGDPLAEINLSRRAPETISHLNATITLQGPLASLEAIALSDVSGTILGGKISIATARYDLSQKKSHFNVSLQNIALRHVLELKGDFSGSFNAAMSGNLPVELSPEGFSITNGRLSSAGTADITHTPKHDPQQAMDPELFGTQNIAVNYNLSGMRLGIERTTSGEFTMDFAIDKLVRRKGTDAKTLLNTEGTLGIGKDQKNPAIISIDNFKAGFLGGSIGVEHVLYDMKDHRADFILAIEGIRIQDLITLQGLTKVSTTGSVAGNLPISIDGPLFEVRQGAMNAEQNGTIIYSASEEELLAAHQSLKTTYAALSDFHYTELKAAINIEPDGSSLLQLQLKGYNPAFQNGRPVHLNLNVEQNLLDLLRSLTISTNVEQAISEKALQRQAQ